MKTLNIAPLHTSLKCCTVIHWVCQSIEPVNQSVSQYINISQSASLSQSVSRPTNCKAYVLDTIKLIFLFIMLHLYCIVLHCIVLQLVILHYIASSLLQTCDLAIATWALAMPLVLHIDRSVISRWPLVWPWSSVAALSALAGMPLRTNELESLANSALHSEHVSSSLLFITRWCSESLHKFQTLPPNVLSPYKLISLLCFLTCHTLFISPI